MTKHARSSFLLTTLVAAMSVAGVATANVTNDDIRADATNNNQVVTNGMGLQGQRFSTLDLLNTDNVAFQGLGAPNPGNPGIYPLIPP